MNSLNTLRLETPRLVLRRAEIDDAQAGFDNYASDPEVTKFLTWKPYDHVQLYEWYLEMLIHDYPQRDFYSWLIDLKGVGVVGSIAFVGVHWSTETVDLGYALGRPWWGQGLMPEAVNEIIRFAFEEVEVNRVVAQHDVNNPRSGRVMQKCGMTYEGTLRQGGYNNRGIVDICQYSLLASEYFEGHSDPTFIIE